MTSRLVNTLRSRGRRLTPQRRVILETLERARHHTTADDVARRVGERFPGVNASTVYRTLELLEGEGLVTHTHFDDGVTRWHLASAERHQHLVCRGCGEELELEVALLEPAARRIRERFGFDPDMAHFSIAGTCSKCRDTLKS